MTRAGWASGGRPSRAASWANGWCAALLLGGPALGALLTSGCSALEIYLGALPAEPPPDLQHDLLATGDACDRVPFDLGPSCGSGTVLTAIAFADETSIDVGGVPLAVAAADLDGDGRKEVVVALATGYLVLRNPGDGRLLPGPVIPLPMPATLMAIGDYDGDGDLDLAFGGGSRIRVERNEGRCGFVHAVTIETPLEPGDLRSGSLNADGLADLAFISSQGAGPDARSVGIAYGAVRLRIQSPLTLDVGGRKTGLAVADLDADGAGDLVVVEAGPLVSGPGDAGSGSALEVYFADRQAGLSRPPFVISVHDRVLGVRAADLDGDGAPDLVVRYGDPPVMGQARGGVATFHNNRVVGSPVELRGDFSTVGEPVAVVVDDFDHDGRSDVIIATGGAVPRLIPVRNAGAVSGASIAAGRAVGAGVTDLIALDLDCDPYPDLLVVHGGASLGKMLDAASK